MITVVDARMGRGKTSAAIRYMNENKHDKRFLYATPYLTEVKRIMEECGFEEPEADDRSSKLAQLKALLHRKKNIATTHAMFTDFMDDEAFQLVEDGEYTLILDESIRGIETVSIDKDDLAHMLEKYAIVDEKHNVRWVNGRDYSGKLVSYKKMADDGGLFYTNGSLFYISGIAKLLRFSNAYVLTYLFAGQSMRACLEYFKYSYNVVGVETDEHGFKFSDKMDAPPPVDYRTLIHIIGNELDDDPKEKKMNAVGDGKTALSVSWYKRKGRSSPELKKLRGAMQNLARSYGTKNMIWTVYKDNVMWFSDSKKRYLSSFVSLNARATNNYKDATVVEYLANRFVNTNIMKFLSQNGVHISQDDFALSEMVQFIWRSAIRDGKPITLYIPSRRMRGLLNKWIDEQAAATAQLTV